jgi:predicted RNA polymerase sigma factor
VNGTTPSGLLQAAIAACHVRAFRAEDTDWNLIAELYTALARLMPSPVVELNRAVALSMAVGPQAGLDLADQLTAKPKPPGLRPRPPAVRAPGTAPARS